MNSDEFQDDDSFDSNSTEQLRVAPVQVPPPVSESQQPSNEDLQTLSSQDIAQLKRNSSLPARASQVAIDVELRRVNTMRPNMLGYEKSPYYSTSTEDIKTPGITAVKITVANSVNTPTPKFSSPISAGTQEIKIKDSGHVKSIILNRPNLFRAFGRRAIAYQKRQWFNNICCTMYDNLIRLCPFLMVFLSFHIETFDLRFDFPAKRQLW